MLLCFYNGGSKPPPYKITFNISFVGEGFPLPHKTMLLYTQTPHPSTARDPSVTARLSFSSEAKNLTSGSIEDDGGRLPPSPEGKARQRGEASLSRKGIREGKTCAEFCEGKIQAVVPLACFFASVSFHEKRNAKIIFGAW